MSHDDVDVKQIRVLLEVANLAELKKLARTWCVGIVGLKEMIKSDVIKAIVSFLKHDEKKTPEEKKGLVASIQALARNASQKANNATVKLKLVNYLKQWVATNKPGQTMSFIMEAEFEGNAETDELDLNADPTGPSLETLAGRIAVVSATQTSVRGKVSGLTLRNGMPILRTPKTQIPAVGDELVFNFYPSAKVTAKLPLGTRPTYLCLSCAARLDTPPVLQGLSCDEIYGQTPYYKGESNLKSSEEKKILATKRKEKEGFEENPEKRHKDHEDDDRNEAEVPESPKPDPCEDVRKVDEGSDDDSYSAPTDTEEEPDGCAGFVCGDTLCSCEPENDDSSEGSSSE